MLLALAADAVMQVLHLGRGVGLHGLPLTLGPVGGLPGLLLRRALAGGDIRPGLADARLDLLVGFVPGLVSGTLQFRYACLKGVDLLRDVHDSPRIRPGMATL